MNREKWRGPEVAAVPLFELRRGDRTMILLYGCPPPLMCASLKRAGLLVGAVLGGSSLISRKLTSDFDYVFVGLEGSRERMLDQALSDCTRKGWMLARQADLRQAGARGNGRLAAR
jgi:hypothetical protein